MVLEKPIPIRKSIRNSSENQFIITQQSGSCQLYDGILSVFYGRKPFSYFLLFPLFKKCFSCSPAWKFFGGTMSFCSDIPETYRDKIIPDFTRPKSKFLSIFVSSSLLNLRSHCRINTFWLITNTNDISFAVIITLGSRNRWLC